MAIDFGETIKTVGSIGGFAGFISLFIHLANFFRDKPKVIVDLQWDAILTKNAPEMTRGRITVKNIGRRPVYIDNVVLEYPGATRHLNLLTDGSNPISRKLEEGGEPISIEVPQTQALWKYSDKWRDIRAVATDISGKDYKSKKVDDKPSWASLAVWDPH